MDTTTILSEELKIPQNQVAATLQLIEEGNTIPFIARYRKEATGGLDDQVLRELFERYTYLNHLKAKKEEVFRHITELELMTEEIEESLQKAKTQTEVEDIYRPFRPKRRTRASVAKERGLQPFSDLILAQTHTPEALTQMGQAYVNPEKDLPTIEDVIQGGFDILAELISDNPTLRKILRDFLYSTSTLISKSTKEETHSVYTIYYDFKEKISGLSGYKTLAINRGEKEGILKVSLGFDPTTPLETIANTYVLPQSQCKAWMTQLIEDSFKRLIFPSLEREIRNILTEIATKGAIDVFSKNLRQLLLQPPVKNHVTLGLDPAYRTGCKIAIVDKTGKLLDTTVIFPTPPQSKVAESERVLKDKIKQFGVTLIAIGNGTASKESEIFVVNLIKQLDQPMHYIMVSEAGASVYSASKLAATEFPHLDVAKRSAISIARRLQDPLAELVKIEPKAIGVGQYQHDMPQKELETSLAGVVESCVNSVGVELNTASASLLSQVAGINASVAKNIVAFREEYGVFSNRKEILKVPKLGKKAFLQAAGFLRISNGTNILDHTGVHPESYHIAEQLLSLTNCSLEDVKNNQVSVLKSKLEQHPNHILCQELNVGLPTLLDIKKELLKPGRDPRDELQGPVLRSDILDINDLSIGDKIMGTVRNVIDFGAFVDIGVHIDGLIHISKLSKAFVKHPLDVVKIGDVVEVTVIGVEIPQKRISLSMIEE